MKKILSVFFFSLIFSNLIYADKIAIIGGGASGLTTAWLLEQNHDVTLYEAKDKLGGHVNTLKIMINGSPVYMDSGAEFYNLKNYPHFMNLLTYFKIPLKNYNSVITYYKTDNSDFIMLPPIHHGQLVWESMTPKNLERALYLVSFINNGYSIYSGKNYSPTLVNLADKIKLPMDFRNNFLYPFLSGYWGQTIDEIKKLPAYATLLYLEESKDNNNLWYEPIDGLQQYIDALQNSLKHAKVKLNSPVVAITHSAEGYTIVNKDGTSNTYDQIVVATNANIAGKLLENVPGEEAAAKEMLKITYYQTKIAIHGDKSFMPPNENHWSVFNVGYDGTNTSLTIYKDWKSPANVPIFKSWYNYDVRIGDKKGKLPTPLYGMFIYHHPVFDTIFFDVSKTLRQIQGKNNIWFAGAWMSGDDSQEGAMDSAIAIAEKLSPNSDRLKVLKPF